MGVVSLPRSVARLLAALPLLALAAPAQAAVPAAERSALMALYNATGGAHWTDRTGWLGAAGTRMLLGRRLGATDSHGGTTVTGLRSERERTWGEASPRA